MQLDLWCAMWLCAGCGALAKPLRPQVDGWSSIASAPLSAATDPGAAEERGPDGWASVAAGRRSDAAVPGHPIAPDATAA